MTAKRLVPLLLALTALALAACGGDDDEDESKLDTGSIEERLTAKLEEDTTGSAAPRSDPLDVTSLECPDEVEKKKGTEFECDVEASGGLSGSIEVELDDDEGEGITYESQLEAPNRSVGSSGSLDPGEP